jgi:hypothetical protein
MRTTRRAFWMAGLTFGAWCAVAGPATAHHTIFSSSVERFEIDGNAFGPADGTLDQIDEFDDGVLAPNWGVLVGTAVEAGGVVTLKNPGLDVSLVPGVTLDVSNVENTTDVANGAGDFTATSYWVATPLGTNREIHFQLYGLGSTIEAAGITIQNLDAATAGPNPVGYSATQSVSFFGGGGGTPQMATVAINQADITGPIVLRMAFDDATDMMTCSFSIDGGVTFQSPFPPMHVFQVLQDLEILLGAASIASTTPPPPPPPVQRGLAAKLFSVKNPSTPIARKILYQIKDLTPGPLLYGNPTTHGATLNVRLSATDQCFHLPAAGWSYMPAGYRYSDSGGRFGPVKSAKIGLQSGGILGKVVILGKHGTIDLVPTNPTGLAYTNLHLGGTQPGEYCSSTSGGTITADNAKVFKVKNLAVPAGCDLVACSPSGAFLGETDGGL